MRTIIVAQLSLIYAVSKADDQYTLKTDYHSDVKNALVVCTIKELDELAFVDHIIEELCEYYPTPIIDTYVTTEKNKSDSFKLKDKAKSFSTNFNKLFEAEKVKPGNANTYSFIDGKFSLDNAFLEETADFYDLIIVYGGHNIDLDHYDNHKILTIDGYKKDINNVLFIDYYKKYDKLDKMRFSKSSVDLLINAKQFQKSLPSNSHKYFDYEKIHNLLYFKKYNDILEYEDQNGYANYYFSNFPDTTITNNLDILKNFVNLIVKREDTFFDSIYSPVIICTNYKIDMGDQNVIDSEFYKDLDLKIIKIYNLGTTQFLYSNKYNRYIVFIHYDSSNLTALELDYLLLKSCDIVGCTGEILLSKVISSGRDFYYVKPDEKNSRLLDFILSKSNNELFDKFAVSFVGDNSFNFEPTINSVNNFNNLYDIYKDNSLSKWICESLNKELFETTDAEVETNSILSEELFINNESEYSDAKEFHNDVEQYDEIDLLLNNENTLAENTVIQSDLFDNAQHNQVIEVPNQNEVINTENNEDGIKNEDKSNIIDDVNLLEKGFISSHAGTNQPSEIVFSIQEIKEIDDDDVNLATKNIINDNTDDPSEDGLFEDATDEMIILPEMANDILRRISEFEKNIQRDIEKSNENDVIFETHTNFDIINDSNDISKLANVNELLDGDNLSIESPKIAKNLINIKEVEKSNIPKNSIDSSSKLKQPVVISSNNTNAVHSNTLFNSAAINNYDRSNAFDSYGVDHNTQMDPANFGNNAINMSNRVQGELFNFSHQSNNILNDQTLSFDSMALTNANPHVVDQYSLNNNIFINDNYEDNTNFNYSTPHNIKVSNNSTLNTPPRLYLNEQPNDFVSPRVSEKRREAVRKKLAIIAQNDNIDAKKEGSKEVFASESVDDNDISNINPKETVTKNNSILYIFLIAICGLAITSAIVYKIYRKVHNHKKVVVHASK